MIPIRDTPRARIQPVFVYLIIIANLMVFAYELALGENLQGFVMDYGLVPARYFNLADAGPSAYYARFSPIFSSMFIHGGWLHVIFNMLFLYTFGDNVEDRLGRLRFAVFYLVCGAAAAYLQLYLNPESELPMVGASGAIAGVMGGYLLLFPKARVLTLVPIFLFIRIVELPAYFFIGFWFLLQFVIGTTSLLAAGPDRGGVAYWAHIGGFIAGVVLVKLFEKRDRGRAQQSHG